MRWSDVSFSDHTVRQFAALWIVFLGMLAVWQGVFHGRLAVAITLAVLAVTLGPLGFWRPRIIRPIYIAAMAVTFPIGWGVSHIVLAVIFYGLITPIAILFWVIGRDALKRELRMDNSTYWIEKPPRRDIQRYFRQY